MHADHSILLAAESADIGPHVLEGQGPVRHRQDVWWASVCAVHVRRGHEEPRGRDHEWYR